MERLVVSEELRRLLPTPVLERLIAQRETTELVCAVCGETITPEDPSPVSVLLRFRADDERPVVQYAHVHCAPSGIRDEPVVEPRSARISYLPLLRPSNPVPAVLLWEPVGVSIDSSSGQIMQVAAYRELHGFQPSEAGLETIREPLLGQGWVLRSTGGDLVLEGPGGALEQFDDFAASTDATWRDAVRKTRRCTLVFGELGLERPSFERIDALLADARAVTATVRARLDR